MGNLKGVAATVRRSYGIPGIVMISFLIPRGVRQLPAFLRQEAACAVQ